MCRHRFTSLLALVGLVLGGLLTAAPDAGAAQTEACFAETNQCIRGRFLEYWQATGGLAINGLPLAAERRELLEDGREYPVQYVERACFAQHPEHAPPYDVLLGQVGRRMLAEAGR